MIRAKPQDRPAHGHRSKVKAGPVNADRLRSFIERVERMNEEIKALQGDVKDIYSEAKGVGYDVKTMRKIVQLRQQDAADRAEAETLLDIYCHALGMETAGRSVEVIEPTEEELEERAGRIVAEIDRCMALVVDGKPPKIEAIKAEIGCSAGKASKLRAFVAERISRKNDLSVKNENPPEMTPQKGAADAAKPVTAQAAAPRGEITEKREADDAQAETHDDAAPTDRGGEARGGRESGGRLNADVGLAGEARADEVATSGGERPQPGQRSPAENADAVRVAPGPQDPIEAGADAPAAGIGTEVSPSFSPRPSGEAEIAGGSNSEEDLAIPSFLRRERAAA